MSNTLRDTVDANACIDMRNMIPKLQTIVQAIENNGYTSLRNSLWLPLSYIVTNGRYELPDSIRSSVRDTVQMSVRFTITETVRDILQ
jgi:hypothetical protein